MIKLIFFIQIIFTFGAEKYDFLAISDNDDDTYVSDDGKFHVKIQHGTFIKDDKWTVEFGDLATIVLDRTKENTDDDNEGMELSDLVLADGKLWTFDDKTGSAYWVNNFKSEKPSLKKVDVLNLEDDDWKVEWAFEKGGDIFAGSAFYASSKVSRGAQLRKQSDSSWSVLDTATLERGGMTDFRLALEEASGRELKLEAAMYDKTNEEVLIIPREYRTESWDEVKAASRFNMYCDGPLFRIPFSSTDQMIDLNSVTGKDVVVIEKGKQSDARSEGSKLFRGVSAMEWVPNNPGIFAAVKSTEIDFDNLYPEEEWLYSAEYGPGDNIVETYVSLYNRDGEVIMDDVKFPKNFKYEGIYIYEADDCGSTSIMDGTMTCSALEEMLGDLCKYDYGAPGGPCSCMCDHPATFTKTQGSGKCKTSAGADPKHSYIGNTGFEGCQSRCIDHEECYGFSVSKYDNCLLWLQSDLIGGGDDWGEADCFLLDGMTASKVKTFAYDVSGLSFVVYPLAFLGVVLPVAHCALQMNKEEKYETVRDVEEKF